VRLNSIQEGRSGLESRPLIAHQHHQYRRNGLLRIICNLLMSFCHRVDCRYHSSTELVGESLPSSSDLWDKGDLLNWDRHLVRKHRQQHLCSSRCQLDMAASVSYLQMFLPKGSRSLNRRLCSLVIRLLSRCQLGKGLGRWSQFLSILCLQDRANIQKQS